ncbi:MAG: hypothetical protein JSW45_05000, partial [Thiotrichales bacterium]
MSATISTAVLVITVMLASGCATTAGLVGFGKESEKQIASASCASEDRMLDRWSTISGVLTGRAKRTPANPTPPLERVRLIAPSAVAAQSVDIFIADTAQKKIFKYDRATQVITTFVDVPDMGNVVQLYVDRGLSVYLVDQFQAKTTQYDIDGRVLQVFENSAELPQPVSAVVDDVQAEVFIADQLRAHVLVFNRAGAVNRVVNAPKSGKTAIQSISAMGFADNQLYIVDSVNHEVHALSPTGAYRYSFGGDELVQPGAMTVDGQNRVFVTDTITSSIKVYNGGLF